MQTDITCRSCHASVVQGVFVDWHPEMRFAYNLPVCTNCGTCLCSDCDHIAFLNEDPNGHEINPRWHCSDCGQEDFTMVYFNDDGTLVVPPANAVQIGYEWEQMNGNLVVNGNNNG